MGNLKGVHIHRIFSVLLAISLLIGLVGCSKSETPETPDASAPASDQPAETEQPSEVTVGYTTLQSGANAAIGFYIDAAVNIALEEFNSTSDVKINLVAEDAGSTVEAANDATIRLLDNKDVSSILAVVSPDQYTAMIPEMEEAGIPVMVTGAPDEIFEHGYNWLFSGYVTKEQENFPLIAWAEYMDVKNVALLIGNDDTSKALVQFFQEKAEPLGITIFPEFINAGDNDFTANITSARRNEPDAYCILASDADGAKIVRQMKQLGIEEPLNVGGAILVQSFLDRLEPEEIEGMYGQASIIAPSLSTDPRVLEFAEKYKTATEADLDIISTCVYDSAMILFEATAKTGGDPQQVIAYLHSLEGYQGLSGEFTYNEKGLGRHEGYLFKAGENKNVELIDTLPID